MSINLKLPTPLECSPSSGVLDFGSQENAIAFSVQKIPLNSLASRKPHKINLALDV